MPYLINICLICFGNSNNLTFIRPNDGNGTSIGEKLQFLLPELEPKSIISKYICDECECSMDRCYEFKQKCMQNITIYEKYAQQLSTKDGSFQYSSVTMRPDLVCSEHNYSTNNGIIVGRGNSEEFIIKEETSEELVLNDKLESLLHDIKKENSESDYACNQNENINAENIQLINNSASFSTGIETINEQHICYYCPNPYTCEVCNKSFTQIGSLISHRFTHISDKPFICEVCNESFARLKSLRRHQLLHPDEKPHNCKTCKKSFQRLYSLEKHLLIHSDEKPFTCEVCNKSFKKKGSLIQHSVTHAREKSHICEVCNESFTQVDSLITHRFTHEKPFVCKVCNETFARLQSLKQHQRLHPDGKPHICKICKKSFFYLHSLRLHQSIHIDEKKLFVCEVCNKSLASKKNLQSHLKLHSEYKCAKCAVIFTRKSALESHMSNCSKIKSL